MPSWAIPAGSISTVAPEAGMPAITIVPPRRTSCSASSTAAVAPAATVRRLVNLTALAGVGAAAGGD